jgi:multidrug efflux system membrane fusion protein
MDQNVKYLYVLDDNDHVVRRDVTLGTQQGPLQVITEGLKAGERVVVSGLQHVRPGMTVTPRLVPMPTTTHTASPKPQAPGAQPGKGAPQPAPSMKQNPPPASQSRS